MIVVSDSSPLIHLARLGLLSVLPDLFGQVIVPPAVWREVTSHDLPGAAELSECTWLVMAESPRRHLAPGRFRGLDAGEAEALALALELRADLVLVDDAHGRTAAAALGLVYTGLLGVLLRAKIEGLIPLLRPQLEALRDRTGFHLSDLLFAQALAAAGEL